MILQVGPAVLAAIICLVACGQPGDLPSPIPRHASTDQPGLSQTLEDAVAGILDRAFTSASAQPAQLSNDGATTRSLSDDQLKSALQQVVIIARRFPSSAPIAECHESSALVSAARRSEDRTDAFVAIARLYEVNEHVALHESVRWILAAPNEESYSLEAAALTESILSAQHCDLSKHILRSLDAQPGTVAGLQAMASAAGPRTVDSLHAWLGSGEPAFLEDESVACVVFLVSEWHDYRGTDVDPSLLAAVKSAISGTWLGRALLLLHTELSPEETKGYLMECLNQLPSTNHPMSRIMSVAVDRRWPSVKSIFEDEEFNAALTAEGRAFVAGEIRQRR